MASGVVAIDDKTAYDLATASRITSGFHILGIMPPRTLFDKLWDAHVVHHPPDAPALLYIDLHLVHEVTSPQAFDGLRAAGRKVRRPELTVATADHNVPTTDRRLQILDEIS